MFFIITVFALKANIAFTCQLPENFRANWDKTVRVHSQRPSGSNLKDFFTDLDKMRSSQHKNSCILAMSEAYQILKHEMLFKEQDIKKIIDNSGRIPAAKRMRDNDTKLMLQAIIIFVHRKIVNLDNSSGWEFLLGKTYFLKGQHSDAKRVISNYLKRRRNITYVNEAREILRVLK